VSSFLVRDTGIGIAADKQKVIFESLSAGRWHHQPYVRRHGLGLSLAEKLPGLGGELLWSVV